MKKFWHDNTMLKLVSLVIAILLVIYIDTTQTGFVTQGESNKTKQTATETQTMKTDLQVSVDTDKYYVTGYPEKIKLTIEGSSSLVTSTVNTQAFRAYIDLTKLGVGKHKVRVQVTGLSKQLSYYVKPQTVTVNIQRRKSRTLPVQIEYNKNNVASGYDQGTATVSPSTVEVSGPKSEVNRVSQIVAKLNIPNGLNRTYSRTVILVAEDKNGQQLNVNISPSTAQVKLPLSVSKKTVKLKLNPRNEKSNKVYSLTAKQTKVTVYGKKSVISKLKQLTVNVDLAHINASTTQSFPITLPSGVARTDPANVNIQIKVKDSSATKNSD